MRENMDQKITEYGHFSCNVDTWSKDLNTYFTLGDCLFGAVKSTKNGATDKYECSGIV